jgi:acyl dehydratase
MSPVPELPAAGDRLDETTTAPFDAADVAAYARASGDDNPLHLDPAVAAGVGFAAPPVQGMLILTAFEPALAAWRADLRIATLSGRFLQPLLVGEAVRISGRVIRREGDGVLMRLIAQGPARAPAVIAEAILVPREAP